MLLLNAPLIEQVKHADSMYTNYEDLEIYLKIAIKISNAIHLYHAQQKTDAWDTLAECHEDIEKIERDFKSKKPQHTARLFKLAASAYNLQGLIERSLNDLSNAEKSFRRAHALIDRYREIEKKEKAHHRNHTTHNNGGKENLAYICSNLGFLLVQMGRVAEGLYFHQQANHLSPEDVAILNGLAFALFQIGNFNAAYHCYQQALQFNRIPNDIIWSNLGWLLLEADSTTEAVEACTHAIDLNPPANKYARYYRALAYARQNRFSEALQDLQTVRWLVLDNQHRQQRIAVDKAVTTIEKAKSFSVFNLFFYRPPPPYIPPEFEPYANSPRFVELRKVAPSIQQEGGEHLLLQPVAQALAKVQKKLESTKLSLSVSKAYTPSLGEIFCQGIAVEITIIDLTTSSKQSISNEIAQIMEEYNFKQETPGCFVFQQQFFPTPQHFCFSPDTFSSTLKPGAYFHGNIQEQTNLIKSSLL